MARCSKYKDAARTPWSFPIKWSRWMSPVQALMVKVFKFRKKESTLYRLSQILSVHHGTLETKRDLSLTYRQLDTILDQALTSLTTAKVDSTCSPTSKTMERPNTLNWETKLQGKCQSQRHQVQDRTCLLLSLDICTCTSLQLETWKRAHWAAEEEQHQRSSTASRLETRQLSRILVWPTRTYLWADETLKLSLGVAHAGKATLSRDAPSCRKCS